MRIERAPPKRLLATLRWRTFKTGPDRQVWDQCMQPVADLIDAGYEVAGVEIEWGRGMPFGVEDQTRYLTWCVDECELREHYGKAGQGWTEITLTRESAANE